MKTSDPLLERIEAYNEAQDGGVIIRRASKGYSLFVEEDGSPVARLRPLAAAMKLRCCGGATGTSGNPSASLAERLCPWMMP